MRTPFPVLAGSALILVLMAAAVDAGKPGRVLSHREAFENGLLTQGEVNDLFRLWNECRSVYVLIYMDDDKEAKAVGLRKEDVETIVHSRLRAARIFQPSSKPMKQEDGLGALVVRIRLGKAIFVWQARFEKVMEDASTELHGWTSTGWATGAFGGHNLDHHTILSEISLGIDGFVDSYLRVNGGSCN